MSVSYPAQRTILRRVVLWVVQMDTFNIAVMNVVIVVTVSKKIVHILRQKRQKKHSQQKQAAFW
ncbi:MAG: hypothetical protein HUU01_06850 [Saprospiraceae bacterium]|nr:hypothetical protein [Saprospiraceae bacterium]